MRVLIIGYNPKHAKIFSLFSERVYLLIQDTSDSSEKDNVPRMSENLDYCTLIRSPLRYGTREFMRNRAREIAGIVSREKIDIVFSNRKDDMIQSKKATRKMLGRPMLLATFHNSLAWQNSFQVGLLSLVINRCCDGVICLSSFMYRHLLKCGLRRDKLLFLPNTIEYERFKRKRNYEFQKDGKIRICYTAVIRPLKNQSLIVDAARVLKDEYPLEINLYGDLTDWAYVEEIKEKIHQNGLEETVFLRGRVDNREIAENLCTNDLYLSSTSIEMSPYNILEAKAAALPILASRVPGQMDLIEEGVDGLFFEVGDVADAIKKLRTMIEDVELRRSLGENGYKSVSETKSYKKAAEKMKTFIDDLKSCSISNGTNRTQGRDRE